MGNAEINMSLIVKILGWKTNACANASHYLRNGGVSEMAKDCPSYHGDLIDRR